SIEINDIDDARQFDAFCDCSSGNPHCEHVWATVLLAEQLQAADAGELTTSNGEAGESTLVTTASASKRHEPPLIEWQRRLRALQPRAQQLLPAPIIEYFVGPPPWVGARVRATVQIAARSWRKREQSHGELRSSTIPLADLSRLPEADRMFLSVYDPQVNHNTYYWDRKTMSIGREWPVP